MNHRLSTAFTRLMSSGSSGGNQNPDQLLHTMGLNCYVGSCRGVCLHRLSSNSSESAGETRSPQPSESQGRRATIIQPASPFIMTVINHVDAPRRFMRVGGAPGSVCCCFGGRIVQRVMGASGNVGYRFRHCPSRLCDRIPNPDRDFDHRQFDEEN